MPQTISREQLQQHLAKPSTPVLVEALPAKYYREGHLPGALHLPLDGVESLAPVILPDKRAEIVVYCASATCQNSHIAGRNLENLGYAKVSVYAGGKKDWVGAGLPVEQGGAVRETVQLTGQLQGA